MRRFTIQVSRCKGKKYLEDEDKFFKKNFVQISVFEKKGLYL